MWRRRVAVGERLPFGIDMNGLFRHQLPSGFRKLADVGRAVPADHVAIGADAHALVVGDTHELETTILE